MQNEEPLVRRLHEVTTQNTNHEKNCNVDPVRIRTEKDEVEATIYKKCLEDRRSSMQERGGDNKVNLNSAIRQKISFVNDTLTTILNNQELNISELNNLIYAASVVITGEKEVKPN